MIILDTNVISELMKSKKSQNVYDWVSQQSVMNLFTTTITQAEILYGIAILPPGKRREQLEQAANLMFIAPHKNTRSPIIHTTRSPPTKPRNRP